MRFFSSIKDIFITKKGYFILLILVSVISIALGIFAGINISGGIFDVDLSNIAYIQFLAGDTSFIAMVFKLCVSLFVFFFLIHLHGGLPGNAAEAEEPGL